MKKVLLESKNPIGVEKLDRLRQISGAGTVLILTHDNPDPDALASGEGLGALLREAWGIPSRQMYSGIIGRVENRAMLEILTPGWGQSDILPDLHSYSAIALVDSQPGAGNNRFPKDTIPTIVIDHHPLNEASNQAAYRDIRPDIGATVTLIYQYLEAAGITPHPLLAAAMFYGLHTDTKSLTRGAAAADEIVYINLLELLDREKLAQVEQAGLPRDYFRAFSRGLQAARLHGSAVIAYLGPMSRPDLPAEMADMLIRLDSARAVLCLGIHEGILYFSLRTQRIDRNAGLLAQALAAGLGVAGGHGTLAGGQVDLQKKDVESLIKELQRRFLNILGENKVGEPLLLGGSTFDKDA